MKDNGIKIILGMYFPPSIGNTISFQADENADVWPFVASVFDSIKNDKRSGITSVEHLMSLYSQLRIYDPQQGRYLAEDKSFKQQGIGDGQILIATSISDANQLRNSVKIKQVSKLDILTKEIYYGE